MSDLVGSRLQKSQNLRKEVSGVDFVTVNSDNLFSCQNPEILRVQRRKAYFPRSLRYELIDVTNLARGCHFETFTDCKMFAIEHGKSERYRSFVFFRGAYLNPTDPHHLYVPFQKRYSVTPVADQPSNATVAVETDIGLVSQTTVVLIRREYE